MANSKPDLANYRDPDPANDNDQGEHEGRAVAPTPAGGALTSLAALGAALNKVDIAVVAGRSGSP
jgi:hypothetical protein